MEPFLDVMVWFIHLLELVQSFDPSEPFSTDQSPAMMAHRNPHKLIDASLCFALYIQSQWDDALLQLNDATSQVILELDWWKNRMRTMGLSGGP